MATANTTSYPSAGADSPQPKAFDGGEQGVQRYAECGISYSQVLPVRESAVDYCTMVENDITMFGVEKAMERWRVVCEMFETEDWWPSVVRRVKPIILDACKRRNRLKEEAELKKSQAVVVQTGNNPTAVERANQAIGQNTGNVNYIKYEE